MQEPCAIFVLFSHSVHCFCPQSYGVLANHPKNGDRLCGSKMSRMCVTFTFRTRGVGSGERVKRVAVMGEREAGNELNEQRWLESGKREKLERRGEPFGIVPSTQFLSFVMNFYFF